MNKGIIKLLFLPLSRSFPGGVSLGTDTYVACLLLVLENKDKGNKEQGLPSPYLPRLSHLAPMVLDLPQLNCFVIFLKVSDK